MKDFVFADCETTGLNPVKDELVELSWAVNDGEFKTIYFGVRKVPAFIDDLTKFTARGVDKMPEATDEEKQAFRDDMQGNTLVAANASFDRDFMLNNELWTGHYRLLEFESYAMAKLNLDQVPSMHEVFTLLLEKGYTLTTPDHSSLNDATALRQAFNILRYM